MLAQFIVVPYRVLRDVFNGLKASIFGIFSFGGTPSINESRSPSPAPSSVSEVALQDNGKSSIKIYLEKQYKKNQVYITCALNIFIFAVITLTSRWALEGSALFLLKHLNNQILPEGYTLNYKYYLMIMITWLWEYPTNCILWLANIPLMNELSDAVYQARKGRQQLMPNIILRTADYWFFLLICIILKLLIFLWSMLPRSFFITTVKFISVCMLNSAFCFDYKWYNMGWSLHERCDYLDKHWAYFIGFGMPLSIIQLQEYHFAHWIMFPWCIVSSHGVGKHSGITRFSLPIFRSVLFLVDIPVLMMKLFQKDKSRKLGEEKSVTYKTRNGFFSPSYLTTNSTPPNSNSRHAQTVRSSLKRTSSVRSNCSARDNGSAKSLDDCDNFVQRTRHSLYRP